MNAATVNHMLWNDNLMGEPGVHRGPEFITHQCPAIAAGSPPMNVPLFQPPVEEDTHVLANKHVQLHGYSAWHQIWRWDGIEGHSLIFPASSVSTLDSAALRGLVIESGYAEAHASFTFARQDEWAFVNFNFRDLND